MSLWTFESYFDDDYTLKKLTTENYIRDHRFEALGVGLRYQPGEQRLDEPHLRLSEWLVGDDIGPGLARVDWSDTACLCHHAQFDGLILNHHYGIRPALWLDTLSMARMVVGNHLSVGLDALARHYGLAGKTIDYKSFKGKRALKPDTPSEGMLWPPTGYLHPHELRELGEGCLHDVDITWRLFQKLTSIFPVEEYRVIDMTVRMFTEPVLRGNIEALGKVWMDEEARRGDMVRELGLGERDLQSSDEFANLLRDAGVEPGIKASPSDPEKTIYAFARTDEFMKELVEQNDRAGALARARLGVRSTIDQTRAERLGWMATRGALPVYLRYCGAHTGRWSGGDNLNWQNFRRGGAIRRAVEAPENSSIIVLDLAQIECRMLNVLAGEDDVVSAFRDGTDIYSITAGRFYGRNITKADKTERHLGKVLELGCGYGMGSVKLTATCRAGALGGPPIVLSEDEANAAIGAYRSSHPAVVAYWHTAGRMIARIAGGPETEWGPMTIRDHHVYLPNGAWINYETLEYDAEWKSWKIKTRQGWSKLYGGRLVENIVQALARVVLSQAMLRIAALGYRIVNCTHDEVMIIVEKSVNESLTDFDILKYEMEKSPAWLPSLPVKAEGGVSTRYDK